MKDKEITEKLKELREIIYKELERYIVGYREIIDLLMTAIISEGHTLIIGVPGLAKTLLIKSIAKLFSLNFNRIQFTPDLMPIDITGSDILEEDIATGKKRFRFVKGPIFANIILADEINRASPKTQSALLEAMQEKKITFGGKEYRLERPFIVFATQNPIEQQGTYPLPEAQLDRFMLSIELDYPSYEDELIIARKQPIEDLEPDLPSIIKREELNFIQTYAKQLPVAEHILKFAVKIIRETRPKTTSLSIVKEFVLWGASPRASQHLIQAVKSFSLWKGEMTPSIEDLIYLIPYTISHRIVLNFKAEAENVTKIDILNEIIKETKIVLK